MHQQRKKRIRRTDKLLLLSSKLQTKLKAFNHHLLHSDKSTYFYNNKHSNDGNSHSTNINNSNYVQDSFLLAGHFLSGIGWTSPHCELDSSSSDGSHWDRTRSSLLKMSHRKMAQLATVVKSANVAKSSMLHRTTCSTIPLVLCGFALLGLGIGLINPSIGGVGIGSSNGTASAAPIVDNITDRSSIAFSLMSSNGTELGDNSTVSTEVTPGLVNYITTNIKLTTTLIDRFYVGVQSTSSNSNLIGTNNQATIAPVETVDGTGISPSSFKDNTWGYALSDNTSISNSELAYLPLPSYSTNTPVQYTSTSNLANGDYNLKLVFAAKINANSPADHYTTNAIVSVAADAKEIGFLNASGQYITTMQEMTSDICAGAPEGYTTQLKDSRDNKYYWVAKLKDNNCWMTQNLDFDIPKTLSSTTTDVQEDTEGTTKTVTTDTIKVNTPAEWNSTEATYNAYYDPGDYYYLGSKGDHGPGTGCNVSNNGTLANCSNFTTTGDAHYHIGNYYSFPAATVKSGIGIADEEVASDSICPYGWQVPIYNGGYESKDFHYMLAKYGLVQNLNNGDASAYGSPAYLVYGGSMQGKKIAAAGMFSIYWNATVYSQEVPRAYSLLLSSNIFSLNSNNYEYGLSVRCVNKD